MRVFIAIDVPNEIRGRLAEMQERLRPASSKARWVAPDSIHITLKFIGEIAEERRQDIDNALTGLTWKPLGVAVRGIGFFPGNRSPRVLWAGVECPTMEGLANEVDTRLVAAGFDSEKRAFRAHLTLARTKESRLETTLVKTAEPFEATEFGAFQADRFHLYQSTMKPGGSVYTKLKEYPL
ncbi:MAG TPA: RNA 2',3'-cyclic phosphodiesterase [Terriglobia bacterium]|nr:RNA 2',3'-cyclic phosphodiesterase [Terriglobia bacterium]